MHPLLSEKGYAVFPSVVPPELCQAVVADIEIHTERGQWGGNDAIGLVEMYHYQSMWDVRQHPAVHKAFATLFNTDHLWVTMDRVCRKPPSKEPDSWPGFIHWDLNPNIRPRVREVQGLVALTDTTEEMGGFHCLPDLYKNLDEWLDSFPTKKTLYTDFFLTNDGKEAYEYGLPQANNMWKKWPAQNRIRPNSCWPVEKVPLKAGDLLIWDSYLPHGNGANKSDSVRYCQYLSMFPASSDERLKIERITCYAQNLPPSGLAFFGDPRNVEQSWDHPAFLSALGMQLLGIIPWEPKPSPEEEEVWCDSYAACSF